MNDRTFENYQKRMLDAMQSSSKQNNDPFIELCNILNNLQIFVNNGTYSQSKFRQEVENQFKSVDLPDAIVSVSKKKLNDFCATKNEALKTILELYYITKSFSEPAVAVFTNECIVEIEKSIFHSK